MGTRARRGAGKHRRGKAGETLTETLVAMLIIGLSSVLFLTMIGASGKIFRKTEARFDEIYDQIEAADLQDDPLSSGGLGTVTVKGAAEAVVTVNWYGDADYVLSYQVK